MSKDDKFEQTSRLTREQIEEEDLKYNEKKKKPSGISLKYRKKYGILALIVVIFFIAIYPVVRVKEIDFKKAKVNIEKVIDKQAFLKEDEDPQENEKEEKIALRRFYNIDKTEIDNYLLFAPNGNMSASEILIVKSKPEYTNKIYKGIEARIAKQKDNFKAYAQEQYPIIDGSSLTKRGDYVIFVSCKNVRAVEKAIKESYK